MIAQPLPALTSGDPSAWDQALYAFLVEKGNRSGSRRTVESYSRMLWPFFAERSLTPDRVKPGDVLAWVHGIGRSGRTPSSTTVGARIACLSSFYRFLIRMGLVVSNPCDPATIGTAVGLFERYALGTVSSKGLAAETGLEDSHIRGILMNPLYNGWIRRHRGPNETRRPASWRANPPVSDELWARVEDVRRAKFRGAGPRNRDRVDLLGGLLQCICGRRIRSDGAGADGRPRKLHTKPCEEWGTKARLTAETWEVPILAQLSGVEIDDGVIARVVAALGSTVRPVAIDRSRIERQMRELALDHVGGGITDETYLERMKRLRTSLAEVEDTAQVGVPAERAGDWLRALSQTWQQAEVPEARSELLHAIYERIVVAGREFVSARLTPAAYAHGLALALPEKVVMVRPTRFELATFGFGGRRSIR